MTSHCIVSGQRVMAGKTELYGGGFSGIMHTEHYGHWTLCTLSWEQGKNGTLKVV